MPSPNPRIQVCASPDLYARVKTLAKGRGITLSNMVQELCEVALSTEQVREEYEEACKTTGEVPVKEDKRQRPVARPWAVNYTEEDRKKAMKVLGIEMKSDEQAEKEKWEVEKEMDMDLSPEMKKALMNKLVEKLLG